MSLDFDVIIESEAEEDPAEDGDTVKDLNDEFRQHFHQIHQESASLKKKYIKFASSTSDFSKIAIGLGNEMQVYDVNSNAGLSKYVGRNDFGQFDQNVSGVRFFNDDVNTLLVSTIVGEIHLYDLRTFSRIHTFEGEPLIFVLLAIEL